MIRSRRERLLLGHRGARAVKSIPENTMASFDRALADGCDGFEFDVRLTADGDAVICHDAKVGKVEIAKATAGQLPRLPRLKQMIEVYRDAFLDIELKVVGTEKMLLDLLGKWPPRKGFVVSSFLPEALEAVHSTGASVPLGLICETRRQLRRWEEVPVEYVMPHLLLVDEELVEELHAAGKKVIVWTVNMAAEMRRFAQWGVEGIISDRTGLLARTLGV